MWLMCAALVAVFSFVLLWTKRAPRLTPAVYGRMSRQMRRSLVRRDVWRALCSDGYCTPMASVAQHKWPDYRHMRRERMLDIARLA